MSREEDKDIVTEFIKNAMLAGEAFRISGWKEDSIRAQSALDRLIIPSSINDRELIKEIRELDNSLDFNYEDPASKEAAIESFVNNGISFAISIDDAIGKLQAHDAHILDDLMERQKENQNKDESLETQLKNIFNSLSRGTSGRLIIESYEEKKMKEIIDILYLAQKY